VGLGKASDFTSEARLRVEQPDKTGISSFHPELQTKLERGAYVIPLSKETTWVALVKATSKSFSAVPAHRGKRFRTFALSMLRCGYFKGVAVWTSVRSPVGRKSPLLRSQG
jgi:hypothetical protein